MKGRLAVGVLRRVARVARPEARRACESLVPFAKLPHTHRYALSVPPRTCVASETKAVRPPRPVEPGHCLKFMPFDRGNGGSLK